MGEYEHPSMSFADRFIKLRKDMGVSLREISKETGIGATTLRHYESGTQPGFDNVIKLSEYFGVSLDYLAYGYTAHSYNGNPTYSLREQVRTLINSTGMLNMESDEYHSAKIYCPSYSSNKHPSSSTMELFEKIKEKTKDRFSNYGSEQLKNELMVETASHLLRERELLWAIALYLYSTDDNIIEHELEKGAPADIISTSETNRLGNLMSRLDEFKYDYYILRSVSRKNRSLMFLED